MPIGGETIGTAYVRILASGKGFDKSVKDEVEDDLDDTMESLGAHSSKKYREGWDKELKKQKDPKTVLIDKLEKGVGQFDARGQLIGSRLMDGIRKSIETRFGPDIGGRINENLREAMESGQLDFKGLARRLENIGVEVGRATRQIQSEERRLAAETELMARQMRRAAERDMEIFRRKIVEHEGVLTRYSGTIGRAFGKGSRNDLINFFGALVAAPVTAIGALSDGLNRLAANTGLAVGQFAKSSNKLGLLGGGLVKVGGGAIAAAGSLGIMLTSLGTITAAVSLLLGTVTALVSSLSFALVGAIGAVAGALVPLGVGLAVTIAAFASMDKEAKRAFKGVGNAFKDLGDVAADKLFANAAKDGKALTGVIEGLEKPVGQLAVGMRDVFEGWIKGLQGAEFERFAAFIGRTMPDMFRSLGDITANLAGTLANVWRAATPYVQDFLGWLSGVTEEWQRLTSGAAGQERLTGFFDHLQDSLVSVSGFLGDVSDLIGEILSAGRGSGDTLFDSMARGVRGWTKAIQENPDILGQWFADAEKFGEKVGELFQGLGKLVDVLDSEPFRKLATAGVDLLAAALESLANTLGPIINFIGSLDPKLIQLGGTIGASVLLFGKLKTAIDAAKMSMAAFSEAGAAQGLTRTQGLVRGLAGPAGIGALIGASQTSSKGLQTLGNIGGGALLGFSVGGPVGAAVGGLAGGLLSLFQNTKKSTEEAQKATTTWEDYASTLDATTGAITETTRAMALKALQDADAIDGLNRLGVSTRTAVNAMVGQKGASQEVAAALRREEATVKSLKDRKDELTRAEEQYQRGQGYYDGTRQPTIKALEDEIRARQGNIDSVRRETGLIRNSIQQTRENIAAVRIYGKELKDLPPRVRSEIKADGVVPTRKAIAELAKEYNLTPKNIKTLIEATGTDTSVKAVQKVIDKLKEADKQKPEPQLKVDTGPFDRSMDGSRNQMNSFIQGNYEANLKVNNSDASSAISETEQWLRSIPDETVNVWVKRRSGGLQEHTASGGIFSGAQSRIIGEAGPEAVVPLNRPLAQVDPAVRELSAIAQGITTSVTGRAQKVIEVGGITVMSPSADPYMVAVKTVNHLAASAYF